MAQQLRALTALTQNPHSVLSTHIGCLKTTYNLSSSILFWTLWMPTSMGQVCVRVDKNKSFLKWDVVVHA